MTTEAKAKDQREFIYKFLVRLRDSKETDIWKAAPYLEKAFDISYSEAQTYLAEWLETFYLPKDEQPDDGRSKAWHGNRRPFTPYPIYIPDK